MNSYNIVLAARIAEQAHRGQRRRGTERPYIEHPLRVAELAARYGADVPTVAAALLHDVVEDTSWTCEQLAAQGVGPHVVTLVRLLTKPWAHGGPEDKPAYYRAIAMDHRALTIKVLDRADNLAEMVVILASMESETLRNWCLRYYQQTLVEFPVLAEVCPRAFARTQFQLALQSVARELYILGLLTELPDARPEPTS